MIVFIVWSCVILTDENPQFWKYNLCRTRNKLARRVALPSSSFPRSFCWAAVGRGEEATPVTASDRISSPVCCVAMTHNLCVECECAFVAVCLSSCEARRVRESKRALMQCFPTLPPPPTLLSFSSPLPPLPSSLLCTVDDSDPGQSSETWGERLVPPCRIYAGNRCSPILSPRAHPLCAAILL